VDLVRVCGAQAQASSARFQVPSSTDSWEPQFKLPAARAAAWSFRSSPAPPPSRPPPRQVPVEPWKWELPALARAEAAGTAIALKRTFIVVAYTSTGARSACR
jgi:hypothetical protein